MHGQNLEKQSAKTGKSISGIAPHADKATHSLRHMAEAALAAGGAFVAFEKAKEAIKSTVELGHATERLSAVTGLNAKQASKWIETMKVRGVQTKAVSMAFITLSRNIRTAQDADVKHVTAIAAAIKAQQQQRAALEATGASHQKLTALEVQQKAALDKLSGPSTNKAVAAFVELGVSQDILRSKSPEKVLLAVADGMGKLTDPARRAALAQQIFGRGAQALIPILAEGRKGVEDALGATEKYGAFLPTNVKNINQAIEAQRGLTLASDGLKIAFTTAVLPTLVKVSQAVLGFIIQMRNGEGAGGHFAAVLKSVFNALKDAVAAVAPVVLGLVVAFQKGNPAVRAAVGAILGLVVALKIARTTQIAFNLVMDANPYVLAILALAELTAAIVLLATQTKVLQHAWRAAWDAMKIAFERSLSFILGGISSLLGAIKGMVDNANIKIPGLGHLFGSFGTNASKSLGRAQDSIDAYRRTLTHAADRAKTDLDNIGSNAEGMSHRVQSAVTKMTQSVQTGIVTSDSALGREMKKLGVTVQQVLTGASSHPLQPTPGFYSGGMVTQPGYFAGEEAPQHPEVILATNPAYRNRNLGLWAQAGNMLGVPGFAKGGIANISSMIAEANRVDAKHFPYVWGGGHGSFSGPFDCSGAVSDILHAGGVLNAPRVSGDFMNYGLPGPGAVTLYANPSHVYMSINGKYFGTSGSNPGGGAGWFAGAPRPGFEVRHVGGSVDTIKTPKWTGPGGLLGKIGKKQVSLATKAANQKLSSALASSFGGSFGGGQGSENQANQTLGRQMMLAAGYGAGQWPALRALWSRESGWDANAVNKTSGAYGIPQSLGHGHPYALGDARGQIAWGLNYIKGRYGTPAAAEAHEQAFGWYRKGGIHGKIPGFKTGGISGRVPRFATGGTFSSSIPQLVGGRGSGGGGGLPTAGSILGLPGLPSVGAPTVPSSIQGTISGNRNAIAGLEQSFGAIDQFYSLTGGASFVDPNTGGRNETAIKARLDQLAILIAYRQKIFALWGFVVALTEKLIAANEERVRAFQAVLKSISTKGLKGKALSSAQKHITDAKTAIAKYAGAAATARGDLTSAIGDRQSAFISLQGLLGEKFSVAGTVAQAASSAIDTTSGVAGGALDNSPVTDTATVQALQTLLTQANQRTAVSQAQYGVLSQLPFGGSFAQGGIVPGPLGAPSVIVAHGGEPVGAPSVNIHIAPGMEWLRDFIQVEVAQAGRGTSRTAKRLLPGSTGR